jgi:hypothetical protein
VTVVVAAAVGLINNPSAPSVPKPVNADA